MALVDVVVVNYNAGAYLARAVTALQKQTLRDFRIVIVDNGSTDGSLERLPAGAIPVEVVRAGRNLGFAAGNNLALRRHCTAEWLALLNPDAFPHDNWLERLLAAAERNPEYSLFGSKMLSASDNDLLDGAGDNYHVSGLHWREGHGCPAAGAYRRPREIFAPCAAAALYRLRDVRDAGGFDEDFFCYAEDVDLGFRLRLYGHRCLYVPEAVVEHVGSGLTGTHSDFTLYHAHRNLVWAYAKNMPGWLFWVYLPYHALLNLFSLALFTVRGHGIALWRAKRDALRALPREWAKRKTIQEKRKVRPAELLRQMARGLPVRRCQPRPTPSSVLLPPGSGSGPLRSLQVSSRPRGTATG